MNLQEAIAALVSSGTKPSKAAEIGHFLVESPPPTHAGFNKPNVCPDCGEQRIASADCGIKR